MIKIETRLIQSAESAILYLDVSPSHSWLRLIDCLYPKQNYLLYKY